MMGTYTRLVVDVTDGVATVSFRSDKDTNPFSRVMTLELTALCKALTRTTATRPTDEPIGALVLTGGVGRSFSVGGDFNDVSALSEEQQIRAYLGEIIDLYIAILEVDVPVISAIDGFAIGQGLQVALMTDVRIGTTACKLQMPELENGVACPLGSLILELMLGRARMIELVMGCELLNAQASRALSLLNDVVPVDALHAAAHARATKLAGYPATSFVSTKRIHNARFVAALESVREASSRAHVESFLRKTGKAHFDKILGRP